MVKINILISRHYYKIHNYNNSMQKKLLLYTLFIPRTNTYI